MPSTESSPRASLRSRRKPPQRRRLIVLVAAVTAVAAVATTTVIWFDRHDRVQAGTTYPALSVDGRSSTVLIPLGKMNLTVSQPMATVPGQDRRPPRGGSFVGVAWKTDPFSLPQEARLPLTNVASQPRLALVAGGRSYPLPSMRAGLIRGASGPVVTGDGGAFVAVDGPVDQMSVRVEYDGATQSVDVRSGKRDPGPAANLYTLKPAQPSEQKCPEQRPASGDEISGWVLQCSVSTASAVPYVAGLGWARPGEQWVVLNVTSALTGELAWKPFPGSGRSVTYDVDGPRSTFRLDGVLATSALPGMDATAYRDSRGSGTLIFANVIGAPLSLRITQTYAGKVDETNGLTGFPQRPTVTLERTVPLKH